MSWRVQLQLSLGETRAAFACAILVSTGFTCGSLGSQLLHLGSALPSSFAINGVISTFCCLLMWRAASASPAPICYKAGDRLPLPCREGFSGTAAAVLGHLEVLQAPE